MKKNILMVHNFYQIGGGEHTVYNNECQLLLENGHKVINYTRSNDELKKSKIKLFLLPFTSIWSFKTYREIKKIIKNNNIDVVHCHNTFPLISPSVYYAAKKCKVPVVQTIHNFRFLCPCGVFYREGKICEECLKNNNFKSAIKHKCYRNSKFQTLVVSLMLKIHRMLGTYKKINYIFLTDFNKNKFSKLINVNANNVFVKPNFVSETNLCRIPSNENKFVFVGRLEENKGIKLIINYWKQLPVNYILHIYGTGPLESFVKCECSNVKNIIFHGFKPTKIIFDDLKTSKSLIFSSLCYEGYPMVIAESLSIGCPVISTNIGNGCDVVNNSKAGILYDPNDIESFKNAIEECLINNNELSKNAKDYYNNFLTPKKNYEELIEIYKNLQ